MGEFGTTLADDDVFALDVLNGILNGFGGLLFDEVELHTSSFATIFVSSLLGVGED